MTSAPYPVLYSFRRCPYAMRARLALAVSGQTCKLREVVLAHKPADLLAASPKGTVPVLIDTEGQVVEQSLDIMLWALRRHDPLCWLSQRDLPLEQVLQLVARCDGEFKFHLDRYKYPHRFTLADGLAHRTAGGYFLAELDEGLHCQTHLLSERESLADYAIAPFVRQFAHTDASWFASQPWPHLQAWLIKFEASPLFQQIMKKHEAWTPGQHVILFPATPTTSIQKLLADRPQGLTIHQP